MLKIFYEVIDEEIENLSLTFLPLEVQHHLNQIQQIERKNNLFMLGFY